MLSRLQALADLHHTSVPNINLDTSFAPYHHIAANVYTDHVARQRRLSEQDCMLGRRQ